MRRAILVAAAVFLGALLVFRVFMLPQLIVQGMMVVVPGDERTPADLGLPFEDASFEIEGDRLTAWFVEPDQPRPLAFLLLHGDGETVSDFLAVQKLLFDRGYPSFVFDYGGFGHSDGEHTTWIFRDEPRAALAELLARVDQGSEIVILGHSFGAAVAVEAFHDHDSARLHSVVFNSGPPALRDILHEVLGVPAPVTWLLPNLVNAKDDVSDFDVPVLVVATQVDEVIPYELTLRVYEGATDPKQLLSLTETGHNYLTRADSAWWEPIFQWIDGV